MGAKTEYVLAAALFACITGAALSNSPTFTALATATTFGPFSSREVASAVLLLALVTWAAAKSAGVRKSLVALRTSAPFLLKWTLVASSYYALVIVLLFLVGLWHGGLTVPTCLWVLTVGIAGAFKGMTGQGALFDFKTALSTSLIAGWFVSLYTFNLVVELVYQPLIIVMIVAERMSEEEGAVTRSVISVVYTILGLTAFIPPIVGLVQQPFDRSYIESLTLPIVGLCTLLPLAYVFSLYSLYDGICVRLRLYAGSENVRRYALMRTILRFHVRHDALLRFRTVAARDLFWCQTKGEVDEAFRKHG